MDQDILYPQWYKLWGLTGGRDGVSQIGIIDCQSLHHLPLVIDWLPQSLPYTTTGNAAEESQIFFFSLALKILGGIINELAGVVQYF